MKSKQDYNFLLEPLPTDCNGSFLNTDFRSVLEFLQHCDDWDDEERGKAIERLFFPKGCKGTEEEIVTFLRWYLSCGEEHDIPEKADEDDDMPESEPLYDFTEDSAKIYASFLQSYNIDLRTIEYMHWWVFMALFNGLSSDTYMQRVIELRSKKPGHGKGYEEYNRDLRAAQRAVALHKKGPEKECDLFANLQG